MLGMAQFDLDCLMAKLTGREPTCYENGLEMIFFHYSLQTRWKSNHSDKVHNTLIYEP